MVSFNPIDAVASVVGKVLDKIPDGNLRKEIEKELNEQLFSVVNQQNAGQTELNKIDANSDSFFRAGWRPAMGWVCVLGLCYTYLFQPILATAAVMWFPALVVPAVNVDALMYLIMALLGLGGLRTYEKIAPTVRK